MAGDSGAISLTVCKKYQHHTDMLNGLVRTIKPCGHYYNQERRGQRCPWKPRKSCIVCQIRTCSPRKRIMQSAIRVVRAESGVLCALFRALEPVNWNGFFTLLCRDPSDWPVDLIVARAREACFRSSSHPNCTLPAVPVRLRETGAKVTWHFLACKDFVLKLLINVLHGVKTVWNA